MALIDSLKQSQLDRKDGATPADYQPGNDLVKSLTVSTLDLDGKTPEKYSDNLPG